MRKNFVALSLTTAVAGIVIIAPLALPQDAQARIVNGIQSAAFPMVGAVLSGDAPSLATGVCRGVLIGCQTFLTAAHCITADPRPERYTVFLPHAGFFSLSSTAYY